jgi:MFS family permease
MSTFYPKFSLGFRMGLFSGMYSIAGAFAGLLAYGILHLETSRLQGWQMLFLIEGVLTVFVAILAFTLLPADVTHVWFLTKKERAHAVRRMERDLQTFAYTDMQETGSNADHLVYTAESPLADSDHSVVWLDVQDALKDWKKLLIIVCNILSVLVIFQFS